MYNEFFLRKGAAKMVKFIQTAELEQIARRVWNAKREKASRNTLGEKVASFESMGFQTMSTEFPMRSGEWVQTGDDLEMTYSHGKWDIPGYIKVRKAITQVVTAR
jgi:hypothetical protein